MRIRKISALICMPLLGATAQGRNCAALPRAAQAALATEQQQGWRIIATADLPSDDQALWHQYHPGQCPGVATGHFSKSSDVAYSLALLHSSSTGQHTEELLLLVPIGASYSRKTVVGPTRVVSPFVVWKLPPGRYKALYTKSAVFIPLDSFVYEKMEATATQYFMRDGRLRSILISD